MKRILFATTALVAAGFTSSANAAEWETGVSGYYFLGLGLSDSNDQDGVGVLRDGEFHINGRLTADNGITFQARVEVEAQSDASDQIDENWGRVSGSFGSLMIGGNDSVGYENNVAGIYSPGARIGYTDSFCITSACNADATGFTDAERRVRGIGNGAPAVGVSGDVIGIHYSTPDFYGFQVHGTYQPNRSSDNEGDTNSIAFENNGLTEGDDADNSLFNIAADYNGDFGDFGFGLSGSYTEITGIGSQQWNLAARVDFSGFTVAGFYQDNFGIDEYGVGAQYATGPWTVAGGWSHREDDGDYAAGWLTYAVAPGVSLTGGVEYADTNAGGSDFGGLGYLTLRF